ncbi:PIG-L deacetylase family protein [Pontiella sp.]|uniref:PIG-L deacetylase family protein n=2 Tax=Pontiella sp. TaxID=2837462 RepID=UPI0035626A20
MNADSIYWPYASALMLVAHPDDETLWGGGTILMHPETRWTVAALCRRNDPDRAPKFKNVLQRLGATGALGDLDDGPEQTPLAPSVVQDAVLALVGGLEVDLIITHSVAGEYERHRRHEETGAAVLALREAGKLRSPALWSFAYRDARALPEADIRIELPAEIWARKRHLVGEIYGFAPTSFEMNAARREEAFWRLHPATEGNP